MIQTLKTIANKMTAFHQIWKETSLTALQENRWIIQCHHMLNSNFPDNVTKNKEVVASKMLLVCDICHSCPAIICRYVNA